jgi:hypothetical protein
MAKKIFIILVLFSLAICADADARELTLLRGIVDLHSDASDGIYSMERISASAKEKGISVLLFADCALRKWEYGIWPFRNLIKKTVEENSILRLGVNKYFARVGAARHGYPGLIIIPGAEIYPLYCWKGSPLSRDCSLVDYYKQFLVFGLKAQDYQRLPIVGNSGFYPNAKNGLWIIVAALLIGMGVMIRLRFGGVFGYVLLVFGVLSLLNNLYLPASRFNQYGGRKGMRPYQEVIDYVNKKGGLIFWAHPEMESFQKYRGVNVYTAAHPEALVLTKDYTGFGLTFTDRITMTEPGGIWDELLLEYLKGKRKNPAWIIASLHYDGQSRRIDEVETIFFVKENSQNAVIEALREGRDYVRFNLGKHPLALEEFTVEDAGNNTSRVIIKVNRPGYLELAKIELIRNGKVIKVFEEAQEEWEISYDDARLPDEPAAYYRLKISDTQTLILSNPIFVKKEER